MAVKRLGDVHAQLAVNKRIEVVPREEYLDFMTFKSNDRPLFTELFGPIIGLKEEWAAQGARPDEIDMSTFRYRDYVSAGVPVGCGWMGGEEERILEETDDHIVARDRMGRTVKLSKKAATLALPMTWPVANMDDWRKVKHHYEFSEERFRDGWAEVARQARADGKVVRVGIPGGYDEPRQLLGDENLCLAFYEQPELIYDILDTIGRTAERVVDRVSSTVQVDELSVHEDMAGRSGCMIGPRQVTEFIKPYYRRIWDMVQSRGARLFGQDSDGNMNSVIPAFLDAGLNVMYPMEPAADMDIVKLRGQYGTRLAFRGGIDKHVLRRSREEIVAEIEYKIPPMVRSGGCVLALDHRIPNGTPITNYRFYIAKAWEIIEREAGR